MSNLSAHSIFVNTKLQVQQNWPCLKSYLSSVGHDLNLKTQPKQFSGGFGNLNYLIKFNGSAAVLRRPPMGRIAPGSNDMLREGKILRSLTASFPLAPRCLYLGDNEKILGAPFLIMEYRPGIIIGPDLPDMWRDNTAVVQKITQQLLEILIELHNISPNDIGLSELGRPEGYLTRTANGWFKRAQMMWPTYLPKAVNYIMSWLDDNKIIEKAPVLLHNDFKLDNIIFNPGDLSPVAVIDWDLGTRGDPLWDLDVLLSYWAEPSDPTAMLQLRQMPTTSIGFPRRKDIIDIYGSRSGRSVANIQYYRVLAQFRLAVVFKQIFEKSKDHRYFSSSASRFDALSLGLLEFAVRVANGEFD